VISSPHSARPRTCRSRSPPPTWPDLVASYFKNASQLVLLLAAYLVGWACALGTDPSLRLFYRSRSDSAWRIYGPRLLVSAGCVAVGATVGAAVAGYETWALSDDIDAGRLVTALLVQISTMTAFCVVSGVIAVWTGAPFVSAIVVVGVVFVGSLFAGAEGFARWSPTSLLSPTALTTEDLTWQAGGSALVVSLLTVVALVATVRLRPVRRAGTTPRAQLRHRASIGAPAHRDTTRHDTTHDPTVATEEQFDE